MSPSEKTHKGEVCLSYIGNHHLGLFHILHRYEDVNLSPIEECVLPMFRDRQENLPGNHSSSGFPLGFQKRVHRISMSGACLEVVIGCFPLHGTSPHRQSRKNQEFKVQ